MNDSQFAAYEAKCAAAARLGTEMLPHNKNALFDTLAAAGIDLVTVAFDGYGDSGQFEAPAGFDADNNELDVPNMSIMVKVVDFDTSTVRERTTTVREFIEKLACDLLEDAHSGWEDGEGSHGEFSFSLSERTITLDYNERYIESHHHEHEF
jgi:hypothetical protein